MEGQDLLDHEQLLLILRRLREVFDVCDEDADGFIRAGDLVDLGVQFGRGDEVSCRGGLKYIEIERNAPLN